MNSVRISAPKTASTGEVVEIKVLIQHPMETGLRRDARGEPVPEDIIKSFVCSLDGETIFEAEFFRAMAANPILSFHYRAQRSGTLDFLWVDQHGAQTRETRQLKVV